MKLPQKMTEMLAEESPELGVLFKVAYDEIEKWGLSLHPQDSPNVIAVHPNNGINCVALWIKGRKGDRRIEGEVRVDGCPVDILSTGMRDDFTLHKYDRDKAPLWCIIRIDSADDVDRLCLIAKRVTSRTPNWGSK